MRGSPWLVAPAMMLAGCSASGGPEPSDGSGTLRVGVEQLDGAFVEGFQLSFVVIAPDGEEVTYRWDDLVTGDRLEWPSEVAADDIERWYAGVLVEEIPSGQVTITSKLDIGMEPPGEPCTTRVDVAPDHEVEVRIALTGEDRGCPVPTDSRARG